jgi:hypothetical protein
VDGPHNLSCALSEPVDSGVNIIYFIYTLISPSYCVGRYLCRYSRCLSRCRLVKDV